jgi:hypothetical protein
MYDLSAFILYLGLCVDFIVSVGSRTLSHQQIDLVRAQDSHDLSVIIVVRQGDGVSVSRASGGHGDMSAHQL